MGKSIHRFPFSYGGCALSVQKDLFYPAHPKTMVYFLQSRYWQGFANIPPEHPVGKGFIDLAICGFKICMSHFPSKPCPLRFRADCKNSKYK
jgi:hypothetical protein